MNDTESNVLFKICAELQKCIFDLQADNDVLYIVTEELKKKVERINIEGLTGKINQIWNTLSFHREMLENLEKEIDDMKKSINQEE